MAATTADRRATGANPDTDVSGQQRPNKAAEQVTVVIPAHNEEVSIQTTLALVAAPHYSLDRLDCVVVHNASTDAKRRR